MGNGGKVVGSREGDPESEIGTENPAKLLHTEPGNRDGDAESVGDVSVVGAGGEAEEADTEADAGGEVER